MYIPHVSVNVYSAKYEKCEVVFFQFQWNIYLLEMYFFIIEIKLFCSACLKRKQYIKYARIRVFFDLGSHIRTDSKILSLCNKNTGHRKPVFWQNLHRETLIKQKRFYALSYSVSEYHLPEHQLSEYQLSGGVFL